MFDSLHVSCGVCERDSMEDEMSDEIEIVFVTSKVSEFDREPSPEIEFDAEMSLLFDTEIDCV